MRLTATKWLCHYLLLLLCNAVLLCSSAFAEVNISQSISPSSGSVEDIFIVEVTVNGPEAQKFPEPIFPSSREFTFEYQGKSSQHSIIQGQVTSSTTYKYAVTPDPNLKPKDYKLPQGKFELRDGQIFPLKVIKLPIRKTDRRDRRNKLGVDFTQIVDNQNPYVGQQVLYRAEVVTTADMKEATLSDPSFPNTWVETFGDTGEKPRQLANRTLVYSVREALFPIKSGELLIPARQLLTTIRQRSTPRVQRHRGRFFDMWPSQQTYTNIQRRLVAPAIELDVRPLPKPPQADLKHIPVGNVSLHSEVTQWTIKEGDNISLTITLEGDANLRPYELPDPNSLGGDNFKVYYDTPQLNTKKTNNRMIFTKKFQLAMVAQKPGSFTLPVISVVVFDPYAGEYKTLKTEEHKIIVRPNPNARKLISTTPRNVELSTIDSTKQNITFLTEDLYPQHVGAYTFHSKREIDRTLFLALLIIMPAIAIGWRAYSARFERLYGDPALVRQRNAVKDALVSIATSKSSLEKTTPEIIKAILIEYIGARYRVRSEAFTPTEAGQLIAERLENESLSQEVSKLLGKLERLRYSAAAKENPQKLIEDSLEQVKALIEELDKNSKRLEQ